MTNEELHEEITDIADALITWFVSQEIPNGMAIAAMCKLIAAMCLAGDDEMGKAGTATQAIIELTMIGLTKKGPGR